MSFPRWRYRHHEKLIIFYQFFPGICTITPLAFGVSAISAARFMALDLVGNILWTTVFSVLGYGAGAIWQSLTRGELKITVPCEHGAKYLVEFWELYLIRD